MKSNYILAAALALVALPGVAQETYENAKLVDNDLNGTARYVGMGGAMEALGADISTINTNPAGIGLFRKSYASASFGLVTQGDAQDFEPGNKTNASFDQAGFVYSWRTGRDSYMNWAFNYHKSRNFDMLLDAAGALSNSSQNKLTYQKYRNNVFSSTQDAAYSQVDAFYMNHLLYAQEEEAYYYYPSTAYKFNSADQGYIGEYDFNMSGNIHDRVYLGLTIGLHDVHYKGYSLYTEDVDQVGKLSLDDYRHITGTGVDFKFGAIFRPINNSPFRFGLYVQTPTYYDLTTKNITSMYDEAGMKVDNNGSYDFKIRTPWKFGLSLGHTVGNYLALGATYEYADYGSIDTRINDEGYYDAWYGDYYESSSSDERMNEHTKQTLKGVSTVKLGLEYKPIKNLALRVGYNYLSPMFEEDGYKDGSIASPGTYYASQTSYVNWKDTNRFTLGLGYQVNHFNFDLAYQYSSTSGDYYTFMPYVDNTDESEDIVPGVDEVSNKRSQLLFTVGYRF